MRRLWLALLILPCVYSNDKSLENEHQKNHVRVKRGSSEKRVVCYYTNWSVYRPGTAKFTPQNINPYLCTHLIYAFGGLDKENGLRPFDKYQDVEQGGYAKFTGLKTYNKNLKTLLAIGGWNEGSTRFSPLVADEERRAEFVKNVLKFLRVNHFDGLDLDWEYPAFRDGGKSADRENYAQLVQELREEFERESDKTGRPRLLLTMAVPAGIEYIDKGYDVKKLNKYLDFMNILSYDYHSAFEPAVNHHSPLYPLEEDGEYNFDAPLSIDHTIKHYLKSGADPNKLVLGIPTYGRSYTLFNQESNQIGAPADGPGEQGDATREKGYLAYYEICSSLKTSDEWTVEHPNARAMGPYAYKGNQWVGYDDQQIAKDKAVYVNEKNLGGIMFWSIDNDDFRGTCHGRPYPIIEAAKEALFGINSELPSSSKSPKESSNKESKLSTSTKRTRPKTTSSKQPSSKTSTTPSSLTTPEPPTTPDPGSDFKCKDEGFFPHPRDCKKYFWCLDSGPSNLGIVAHQFTCPSGLFFNKAADSCDFARNVLCKIKSTPAPSKAPITLATAKTTFNRKEPSTSSTSTTSTTTTTTTEAPTEEEEAVGAEAEDPQTIKQLIDLIKKLGGVDELEKQLNLEDKSAPISRSLYDKVIANSGKSRFQSRQQNGPGPQNQGIQFTDDEATSSSRERPKYKTIQRERPSTTKSPIEEDEQESVIEEDNNVSTSTQTPKYSSIFRRRQSSTPSAVTDETELDEEKPVTHKYVTLARNRPSVAAPVTEEVEGKIQEVTQRYVTLKRVKPKVIDTQSVEEKQSTNEDQPSESEVTNENDERIDFQSKIITTSTTRPKEKVSVYIVTPATDPVASVYRTSTWTSIVTSIMEDALTQRTKVKLNHTEEDGRTINDIFSNVKLSNDETSSDSNKLLSNETASENVIANATTVQSSALNTSTDSQMNTSTDSQMIANTTSAPETPSFRLPLRKPANVSRYITFNRNRSNTPSTTTSTTLKPTEIESKIKFSRFNIKPKIDASNTTRKYASLIRYTTSSPSSSESFETTEPSSSTRKYFNRFRSSTTPSEQKSNEDISTSAEGLVTSKYKYILRTRSSTTSKDGLSNNVLNKDQAIEDRIKEILETQEQNEDEQLYENEIDNNVTPSPNIRFTRPLTNIRRSTMENSRENETKNPSSSTETYPFTISSTRRVFSRTTTKPTLISSNNATNKTNNTLDAKSRGQSKYKPKRILTRNRQTIDSNEYEGEEFDSIESANKIKSKNNNRVIEVRIRKKTRNPKQLNGTSNEFVKSIEDPYTSSYEQFSTTTDYPVTSTIVNGNGRNVETTTENGLFYSETSSDVIRDTTFLTTFIPTTEQTTFRETNEYGNVTSQKDSTENSGVQTTETDQTFSTNTDKTTAEDYERISTFEIQTESTRNPNIYTTKQNSFSRGTKYHETYTSNPNRYSTKNIINSLENSQRKPNPSENRRRTTIDEGIRSVTETTKRYNDAFVTRNSNNRNRISNQNIVENSDNKEQNNKINSRRKNSRYTTSTTTSTIEGTTQSIRKKSNITRNRGNIKAYKNPDIIKEFDYENNKNDRNNKDSNNFLNGQYFIEVSTITNRRRYQPNSQYRYNSRDEIKRNEENFVGEESIYFPQKKSAINDKSDLGEVKINRTRVSLRRPTPVRSTTTSSTIELPARTSPRGTFRRRKVTTTTTSAPSTIAQEVNSLSDITTSRSRKFEFPRRTSNLLPEPEALQVADYDTGASEELPELANMAVVAIHNLGTVPPKSYTTVSPSVQTSTEILRKTPFPRQPINIFSQSQETQQSTPIFRSQLSNTQYLRSSQPQESPILRDYTPILRQPDLSQPISPVAQNQPIQRNFLRSDQSTPIVKQKPFTRKLVPQNSQYDYADDEVYGIEPIDIPLSGKVRIHTDGYIECLDMGNFPHPFSCKKFISCAKMENGLNGSLLGWEYTCPKGLSFDPIGGICNWSAGLGCKE